MSCEPTVTPEIDREALRNKYLAERDRRLRRDGGSQYVVTEGEFEEFYESDPYTPVVPRLPISADIDVAILGGGFAGLIAAARLRDAGMTNFRIIDLAGDFGGVWYWNRYPGIQVDTDSYCYLPLLEETGYVPTQKYTLGDECFEHCQRIGKHYNLYDTAIFSTLVRSQEWDPAISRWRIGTNRDDDIRARFVIMAQGPFNRPKLPGIPGIADFEGHTIHTARWDYAYTGGGIRGGLDGLAGKRVAVIGTGASGVQVIPHIAQTAEHLYVFQRTASSIDERGNVPTDPEWAASLQPGWQKERQRNFHTAAYEAFGPGQPDLVCDGYLPTFNRPNVTLVDVADTKGVERITATGVRTGGVDYPVDCIVFASGFEITTDLDRRLAIAPYTGRDGLSLYDHWADGYRTLHGMMSNGFPNHFFTGYVQGGITAAVPAMFEQQAEHIAYVIATALERGLSSVEPTREAQDAWVATIRATEIDQTNFQRECTPGYYNNEGEQKIRSVLGDPYWPGFYAFGDLLRAWRDAGELEGLEVRS